jgi:hypothetical protein
MPNTIILKGRGIRKEAAAGGTITPGHLVTFNSSGQLVVHSVAKQRTTPLFAVEAENLNPGSGIAGGIDDNYVSGDYVQAENIPSGGQVYALVAASATAITKGALLESAGDGTLKLVTDFTDAEIDSIGGGAIARALEAVDNSGGATPARIRAEIL